MAMILGSFGDVAGQNAATRDVKEEEEPHHATGSSRSMRNLQIKGRVRKERFRQSFLDTRETRFLSVVALRIAFPASRVKLHSFVTYYVTSAFWTAPGIMPEFVT
jgi:hypothetical protein